ncbi:hypothetical protein WJX73_010190 [Symbiochloris irregularis]|uniref:Uncharacterized protein n=1 Tax=Symbiochloris irregularis TaxID=706552 RepID=A0AAW1PI00_9CHLO
MKAPSGQNHSPPGSNYNITIDLPSPGQYSCVSLQGVAHDASEAFTYLQYDPKAGLGNGSQLTLFNTSTCSQPLETWSFFNTESPYTMLPGISASGSINSDNGFEGFLSFQFRRPIPEGPILDGYYSMFTGGVYSDSENSFNYQGCNELLGASASNDSLSFVESDDHTGLQQFLFQLVEAPDRYTISIPRGRGNRWGMLAAPACDSSEAVTLVPFANATRESTWVLSSVQQEPSPNPFGFLANITSLARLQGACPSDNATSLGVQTLPITTVTNSTCMVQNAPYLIPGAEVSFEAGVMMGGWGLLPVSPVYCQAPFGECYPGSYITGTTAQPRENINTIG